jgi:hypothetical protein
MFIETSTKTKSNVTEVFIFFIYLWITNIYYVLVISTSRSLFTRNEKVVSRNPCGRKTVKHYVTIIKKFSSFNSDT